MDSAGKLQPGFYWYLEEGSDPEVVQVQDSGEIYYCGMLIPYYLPSAGEVSHTLNGKFVGPLYPPSGH
ncbi:hypothetical protein [Burkholderia sp. Ac-20365]|uniref:hypothetical protein n=1 Tax=Burkholderia sp. Ac-20365 TaxID=2703897 RepID=UPI00197C0C27|nr:hypothetical protein [Burkholderia sp. Ac-20365]MBN3761122.1 hypothetical protein [Burkholderia sp. Ac-20365]